MIWTSRKHNMDMDGPFPKRLRSTSTRSSILPRRLYPLIHASQQGSGICYLAFLLTGACDFRTIGTAVSLAALSTFHCKTHVLFFSSTGVAYHLVEICSQVNHTARSPRRTRLLASPDSLTQMSKEPHRSKPVVVKVALSPALKLAAAKAPVDVSMDSMGEVQLPVDIVELTGSALKLPSLASCVTTEF